MIRLTDEEIKQVVATVPIDEFTTSYEYGQQLLVEYQEKVNQAIAKAQLKKVVEWAIEERKKLTIVKVQQKETDPSDVQSQVILGAKAKAFQQVIDKCGNDDGLV